MKTAAQIDIPQTISTEQKNRNNSQRKLRLCCEHMRVNVNAEAADTDTEAEASKPLNRQTHTPKEKCIMSRMK